MSHTVKRFIDKFEALRDIDVVCNRQTTSDHLQRTALGWCSEDGETMTLEAIALRSAFEMHGLDVVDVNDGFDFRFQQNTPRLRVLTALRWMQQREEAQ